MLRISIVNSSAQRRLIVEGTLAAPWMEELTAAWAAAQVDLRNRKLIIDLENVLISREGENALMKLMSQGAKFRGSGVLTKHVLKELKRRVRGDSGTPSPPKPVTEEPKGEK